MKQLFYTLSFLSVTFLFTSCGVNILHGEGKKGSDIPSVSAFSKVDISIASDVDITVSEGSAHGIEIRGYENILKHIRTRVKNGTLHIDYDLDDTWTIDDAETKLRISVPSLSGLILSGAPDVKIHGDVRGDNFDLDISGASEVAIEDMHTNVFSADMSGMASLKIKQGAVKAADYALSGAGKVAAFGLQTEETAASISGTGKCEVSVSDKLEASISGAGAIRYKGNPQVDKHVSGIGSIEQAD